MSKGRGAALAVLAFLVAGAARAESPFDALWTTANERGERLLRQGDAAAAARTFRDPRWRAYAELQAGDYAAAARGFAAFDDSDAHYNRGNALARGGDLRGALGAYDAALARNPGNEDARRNRELVRRVLEQQPQSNQGGGRGSGKAQGKRQSDSAQGESGQEQGRQPSNAPGSRPGAEGEEGGAAGGSRRGGFADSTGGSAQGGPDSADDAARARADAQAALGLGEAGSSSAAAGAQGRQPPGARDEDAGRDGPPSPQSERQLALDQWLRRIPDDPAGLLQRKFMIERLMKQRGAQR